MRVYGVRPSDIPDDDKKLIQTVSHPNSVIVWAGVPIKEKNRLAFRQTSVKVSA